MWTSFLDLSLRKIEILNFMLVCLLAGWFYAAEMKKDKIYVS